MVQQYSKMEREREGVNTHQSGLTVQSQCVFWSEVGQQSSRVPTTKITATAKHTTQTPSPGSPALTAFQPSVPTVFGLLPRKQPLTTPEFFFFFFFILSFFLSSLWPSTHRKKWLAMFLWSCNLSVNSLSLVVMLEMQRIRPSRWKERYPERGGIEARKLSKLFTTKISGHYLKVHTENQNCVTNILIT